jgi:hypothetical protein
MVVPISIAKRGFGAVFLSDVILHGSELLPQHLIYWFLVPSVRRELIDRGVALPRLGKERITTRGGAVGTVVLCVRLIEILMIAFRRITLQLHLVSLLVLHVKSPRPSGTPLRKGGINLSC